MSERDNTENSNLETERQFAEQVMEENQELLERLTDQAQADMKKVLGIDGARVNLHGLLIIHRHGKLAFKTAKLE